ncbi:MAG: PorT family protein [Salinivirgaceae bacterium]|nr:PorT family protein [Salinivirgaceae bacterium]MBO7593863.1 PorT family protein [Salinivirgaceae bacterium]
MKKILIAAALLFSTNVAMCQLFGYGVKAGLNSTKLKMKDVATTAIKDAQGKETDKTIMMEEAASDLGFHVGGFARINAMVVFVQPEIYYTNMSSHIKINYKGDGEKITSETADVKNHRIDIPVIVGAKFGPARLGLGPVASFNLKSETKVSDQMKEQIGAGLDGAKNTATFAMQVGAGLDILKKVTLDLRYEFGLSKLGDEVNIGNNTFKTDQRANSFIASIGWMF